MNKFGYFRPTDPTVNGIRFGNWGSRPFEYFWASYIEPLEGKDILDIGTGLPSEHTWHNHVRTTLNPKSYLGIDMDDRLKNEEIHEENHKVLYMNAGNLDLPDNSIDVVLSISTFEHIDNLEVFDKVMSEAHRVLRPGGVMVLTLDEFWRHNDTNCLPWNELERAKIRAGKLTVGRSYGICDFAEDISQWFEPLETPPVKVDADSTMLYSPVYNDCVSYGVFKVIK